MFDWPRGTMTPGQSNAVSDCPNHINFTVHGSLESYVSLSDIPIILVSSIKRSQAVARIADRTASQAQQTME